MLIWGSREGICFCGKGWTGQITLIWRRKLAFWCNGQASSTGLITPSLATAGRVAAPAILAECFVDLLLTSKPDHQTERFVHRLLLGLVSGSLLRFRHQCVVDFDIRAHGSRHYVRQSTRPSTFARYNRRHAIKKGFDSSFVHPSFFGRETPLHPPYEIEITKLLFTPASLQVLRVTGRRLNELNLFCASRY